MTHIMLPIDLNIPDIEILEVKINSNGEYEFIVKSTLEGCKCRICDQTITNLHNYEGERKIKHLSLVGRDTYIVIRLPRYKCEDCLGKPTTTQQVPWNIRKSPNTIAYEMHIISQLIGSTVEEVSLKEKIGYSTVKGIITRHVQKEVDWDNITSLSQLGLDEISLKKGHKDFVTIVSSRINGENQILAVLTDRKKETVKKFLSSIPKRLRKQIKSVCSDLYDGFINAAREVLGKKVRIIADRFHVAKLYRKGFDSLRKQEMQRLKKELNVEEYAELKGVMWTLRKNKRRLSKQDKELLKKLFQYSPVLKTAYDLQNDLTNIFEIDTSRNGGKRRIKNWMCRVKESCLTCYDTFLSTLETRLEEIVNYFIDRHSSGFVEGINNKIKVIKRRCYGILNAEHLFQRIFLDFSGRSHFSL